MLRPASILSLLTLLSLGLIGGAARAADEASFEDMESRIDYAWFTEDVNALRSLVQSAQAISQKGPDSPDVRYLLALANYRLGLLLAGPKPADATAAMDHCVEESGRTLQVQTSSAEAYALQGTCYAELARLHNWKTVVNGPFATLKMDKALKLAPNNPRVVLLDGARDYAEARPGGKEQALAKFRRALELFETALESRTGSGPGTPSWGYADTYAYIGRCLQEKGDLLGARNAYERALIIAPDFAAVRRELQSLLKG